MFSAFQVLTLVCTNHSYFITMQSMRLVCFTLNFTRNVIETYRGGFFVVRSLKDENTSMSCFFSVILPIPSCYVLLSNRHIYPITMVFWLLDSHCCLYVCLCMLPCAVFMFSIFFTHAKHRLHSYSFDLPNLYIYLELLSRND